MSDLPPRYYQKPNSIPRFILSLVTVFIMLLALPFGVFLVGQRTHFLPEAVNKPPPAVGRGETSFTLRRAQLDSTDSATLAIDVLARSDTAEANLFATRVNFPSQHLEVSSVATTSAELKDLKLVADKWIEASSNNQAGQVNLIAGKVTPGIKTSPNQEYLLARIFFRIKSTALATFHLDPDSAIFKNLDNTKMEVRKNDLTIDLGPQPSLCQPRPNCLDARPACKVAEPVEGWCPTPSPSSPARFVQFKKQTANLTLISPQGGETIPFNISSQIKWASEGLNDVSIYLLMNGQQLGRVASMPASLNQITWKPANILLPTFLTPTTTFQIQVEGVSAQGEKFSDKSRGPFAIVNKDLFLEASQAANLAQRGGDANHDGVVDLTDLSILLSKFGQSQNLDLGVDLNGDGVVNDVDLWLFKGLLLK